MTHEHYTAPGAHVMLNDGLLPLPPGQMVDQTNAGSLTGGAVFTLVQLFPVFVLNGELPDLALNTPSVPLPPALGLFAAGLGVLGAAARRRGGSRTWPASRNNFNKAWARPRRGLAEIVLRPWCFRAQEG
jgi:hypothetical protein